LGATHMTIVTDTFSDPVEQSREYTIPGQPEELSQWGVYRGKTFDLKRPLEDQIPIELPCSCIGIRPCGCG